jgi:DNA damage-inducible protein 1
MQLTFVTDLGQSYSMDIDSGMELENIMALLEAEVRCSFLTFSLCVHLGGQSGIPVVEQSISYNGRDINAPKSTLRELGVNEDNAMLLLRRKVPVPNVAGRWVVL